MLFVVQAGSNIGNGETTELEWLSSVTDSNVLSSPGMVQSSSFSAVVDSHFLDDLLYDISLHKTNKRNYLGT